MGQYPVFAEMNAHPQISAHQKQSVFKGGKYTIPMAFDGWFFTGGGGSTQNQWVFYEFWNLFLLLLRIKGPGRLFRQIRYFIMQNRAWNFPLTM